MLAFSTCWNSARHRDGEALVREILDLGFDTIELGHSLRNYHLEGILGMVERGDVRVGSVHNFCPLPTGVVAASPDCYEFTSHRELDRERAIKLSLETIRLAARLGAPRVVLHGGRVRSIACYRSLLDQIDQKNFLSKAYCRSKLEFVLARDKAAPLYLARLEMALKLLVAEAAEAKIILGLENRERWEDVPSEPEMIPLLEKFKSPHLGYWHDFGHAGIKENMKFLDHARWLGKVAPQVIGCHLHDVSWPNRDHQLPFSGELDFECLRALLPANAYLALELSPSVPAEAIPAARQLWREKFGE